MSRDPKSGHYDAGGIETLDIIKAKIPPAEYVGYLQGNALKYLCRLHHKGQTAAERARDARKAANYAGWLADEMETLSRAEKHRDMDRLPLPKNASLLKRIVWRLFYALRGVLRGEK